MQITPPHSPPPPHPSGDTAMFAKRPISPPLSSTSASASGETSAAEDSSHHLHHKTAAPVSLLSAILHSPDHSHSHGNAQQAMSSASGAYLSPHSSVPSTVVSSPHLHPSSQGGQQVPAISILRRDSFSSDAETSAGGGCGDALSMQPIDTRTDLPKRACSLKFAVAPPSSKRRQAESGAQSDHQQQESDVPALPKIKADVPQPHRTASEEDTPIAVDRDDEEDEEDDDDDDGEIKGDESEDSDLGYQEDSEQSSDDEDRIRSAPKYPFARSTNYRRRRQRQEEARSPSPPPAPSVLPPPTRRGRGHIRVDESCISGKETEGGCSRHRSPPPAKSRSTSGDRERMGRLSDAGPRRNRAGSPMPTRIPSDEDDEEDDEQQLEPDSPTAGQAQRRVASQPGWRSDDAAFREPVKTARAVSAPSAVISDEEALGLGTSLDPNEISPPASGVRSFFRRASEHLPLPAFRRPSKQLMEPPLLSSDYSMQPQAQQAPHRPAMPINHACPPALDDTPALANSIARVETNYSGGLAHRLEKQLSTRSSSASATHSATPQVHAHA